MASDCLIYGSTGYTGRLMAARALQRGLRPILAGRNDDALRRQAMELGLLHRTFPLDDPDVMDRALVGVAAVLHCAGPFSRTAERMVGACLRSGAHYLDITGEIEVFEYLARRSDDAKSARVMLLPGVGFDVVPSDCLAAHLKRRLPTATRLTLAFQASGGMSRGTATTMIEHLDRGGVIRRGGLLTRVPAAWRTKTIDFGAGPRVAVTIPWGDVATAYYSTGIGDIEVYAAVPASSRRLMRATRYLGWLLGIRPLRGLLQRAVRRAPPGPSVEARARGVSRLWGEVRDGEGRRAAARLVGPEGYTLTALAAVAALEKVLAGRAPVGFQTPSLAFGPDFVLEIEGVTREDEE